MKVDIMRDLNRKEARVQARSCSPSTHHRVEHDREHLRLKTCFQDAMHATRTQHSKQILVFNGATIEHAVRA